MKQLTLSAPKSLFLLRLALGLYFLMGGLNKIFDPAQAWKVINDLFKLDLLTDELYIIGGLQVLLALVFLSGFHRFWSYGAVFLCQLAYVGATVPRLADLFNNQLFWADVPLLVGYLFLFLQRTHDTFLTLHIDRTKYFSDDGRAKVG